MRRWIKDKKGGDGLKELSRKLHNSPKRTPKEIQEKILELYKKTNWGRKKKKGYLVFWNYETKELYYALVNTEDI